MLVKELLAQKGSGVVTVRPELVVSSVLNDFRFHQIGALVVSVDGETLLGMLTERDVVLGLLLHGKRLLDMPVRAAMSTGVATCDPGQSLAAILRTMTDRRARHLPVVEADRLVGVVSIGDVVKVRLDEAELENRVLRDLYHSHR